MSFRSLHVFLTLPRNVTETPQEVEVLPPDDVDIDLEDAEFIVSAILRFNTKVTLGLKSPALLEIQCDLISSRVDDFSELSMIQYDVDSSTWIDVESFAVVYKRFCKSVVLVPQNSSFSLFVFKVSIKPCFQVTAPLYSLPPFCFQCFVPCTAFSASYFQDDLSFTLSFLSLAICLSFVRSLAFISSP